MQTPHTKLHKLDMPPHQCLAQKNLTSSEHRKAEDISTNPNKNLSINTAKALKANILAKKNTSRFHVEQILCLAFSPHHTVAFFLQMWLITHTWTCLEPQIRHRQKKGLKHTDQHLDRPRTTAAVCFLKKHRLGGSQFERWQSCKFHVGNFVKGLAGLWPKSFVDAWWNAMRVNWKWD